jgi:uncharacterized protein YpuA (DUF1002 family)
MTTVTETDLKELKDLIISQNQKLDNLGSEITSIKLGIAGLKGELKQDIADLRVQTKQDITKLQGELKQDIADLRVQTKQDITELQGDIKTLTETVKGLDKRLEGVEIFIRLVGGGIIAGLLLALSKYLFFSELV